MDKNSSKIQKFAQELYILSDRMEKAEEVQKEQSKYKTEMESQMIQLRIEIDPLS